MSSPFSFAAARALGLVSLVTVFALGCAVSAEVKFGEPDGGGTADTSVADTSLDETPTADVGSDTCPSSKLVCGGACIDPLTDRNNCGRCGTACSGTSPCVGGVCKATCSGDTVDCGGKCVNLFTDNQNCGTCDMKCGADRVCADARCKLDCKAPMLDCGLDVCVDPSTDKNNCGKCGNSCPTSFACNAGTCSCSGTSAICGSGSTAACKDLTSDNSNCGKCGTFCDGFTKTCVASKCTCTGSLTDCSGTCTDVTTDNSNCGACGTVCDASKSMKCSGSKCVLDCGALTNCSGTCADLKYDPKNCGACGTSCPAGEYCNAGKCACPSGLTDCGGVCRDLTSDGGNCGFCSRTCATGTVCSGGGCGSACGGGRKACGTSCLDTDNDPKNCGTCGHVCASGICGGGACLTAPKCGTGPYKILFYGPTLSTSGSTSGTPGEVPYLPSGSTTTIATEAMWRAMTTSDFAKYNLIVVGEEGACSSSTNLQALFDTRATWTPAVVGRVLVTEQDPVYHASASKDGAKVFLRATLLWAASGPGTGLYVAADCGSRKSDYLSGFGPFSSTSGGGDTVSLTAPTLGPMIGSTSTSLSNWSSSYHGNIDSYPPSWIVAAKGGTAENVTVVRDAVCGP